MMAIFVVVMAISARLASLFRYPRNYIPPMVLMHCYATNRYRYSYICHLIYI